MKCILECDNVPFIICENNHCVCQQCYNGIINQLPFNIHPLCPMCRSQLILPKHISPLRSTYIEKHTEKKIKCLNVRKRLEYFWLESLTTLINMPDMAHYYRFCYKSIPAIYISYLDSINRQNQAIFIESLRESAKEIYIVSLSSELKEFQSKNPFHDFIAHSILEIWNHYIGNIHRRTEYTEESLNYLNMFYPNLPEEEPQDEVNHPPMDDMIELHDTFCDEMGSSYALYKINVDTEYLYLDDDYIVNYYGTDMTLTDFKKCIDKHGILLCHPALWNTVIFEESMSLIVYRSSL